MSENNIEKKNIEKKKKLLCFNGSPAGRASHTQVLVEAFWRGARRAGAETETVYLVEKNIGWCRGCFACWFKQPGQCCQQDDMQELLAKYQEADVVCFATPVFIWNMTGILKNFADRTIPMKAPTLVQQGDNFDMADACQRQQQVVVIANSGFPGENNFAVLQGAFASCQPALEIYCSCGRLLLSRQPVAKEPVRQYLELVEQAGYQFTANGAVEPELADAMKKPMLAAADYCKYLGM